MPLRSREMNDQPTDGRLRQVIRSILNQEVRRLLTTSSSLTALVAANTTNITTNASAIAGLIQVTTVPFTAVQVWTTSIASQPIEITLWTQQSISIDAEFDTFQFDAVQFDESTIVSVLNRTATVTYNSDTRGLSIDWGSLKSGTIYIINFDSSSAFGIVAVAD